MSKFCENCGAMMNDNDMVCGNCGMPYYAPANQQYAPVQNDPYGAPVQNNGYDPNAMYPAPGQVPHQPAKSGVKKYLPIIIGAVVLVAVIVVIVLFATGAFSKSSGSSSSSSSSVGSYENAIKNCYKAWATGDYKLLENSYSLLNNGGDELDEDDWEDVLEDSAEEFEEENGKFKSVKLTVKDVKNCSDNKIKELYKDNAYDYCDLDQDDITDAKEVKVKVEIIGEDDTEKDTMTVYVVKENGRWKVLFQ